MESSVVQRAMALASSSPSSSSSASSANAGAVEASRGERLLFSSRCLCKGLKALGRSSFPSRSQRGVVAMALSDAGFGCPSGAYRGSGSVVGESGQQRGWLAREDGSAFLRARRSGGRGSVVVTKAIPSDAYWITAAQAIGVSVLMAASAVAAGVVLNIYVEKTAIQEYMELKAKGLIPEDFLKKEEGYEEGKGFTDDDALYIVNALEDVPGFRPTRNRPVREVSEPGLQSELRPEVQSELQTELQSGLPLEIQPEIVPELEPELETANRE